MKFSQLSPSKQDEYASLDVEDIELSERIERKEKARNDFADFFRRTSVYIPEHWQSLLSEDLGKLRFQTGVRKMIHKPPQTGGSMIVSQRLTPFLIGHDPNLKVRLVTHNQTHSERFSNVIRGIMKSPSYNSIFPNTAVAANDRSSVSAWSTVQREVKNDGQPSFMALGLKTGIVGSGANLWIIDDPYANRDEAFSPVINEKIWNTWIEDIVPRLFPEDNVIVMFHRWQENDFAGRLEESGGWDKIRIPSICDSENDFAGRKIGEALTPRYPIDKLIQLRDGYVDEEGHEVAGIGDAIFESLHQGNPKIRGGMTFKQEYFHYIDTYTKDEDAVFVRYWDLGASANPSSDRTASSLIYKTPGGISTIIDHRAGRLEKNERNNWIRNTCQEDEDKYGQVFTYVEQPFGLANDVAEEIIRQCQGFAIFGDRVSKSKEERADPVIAQMQAKNVRFLKAAWNRELEDECLSFPNGKHDDRVDTISGAYSKAAEIHYL